MEIQPEKVQGLVSDLRSEASSDCQAETVEEITTSSMDGDSVSSTKQNMSSTQEPALPILRKIIDLSNNVQVLRKEHTVLSDQVKGMSRDLFPGNEVLGTLQNLNKEYEILKKKFLDESSERRRLNNQVIELKGNIRVFCRCRPLNEAEMSNGTNSVVEFDSTQDNELHIICSDSSRKQFKFDHVFRPEDRQEDVFAQTKPVVTSVLDGYNICIFAYGQTGTGKTFTMEGTPENRGVNYRTLEELFRVAGERSRVMKYELHVSMLEVYNEKIRDLLENGKDTNKKLEVKQAADGELVIPGLVEAHVFRTEEVWELLKSGNSVRSVGSTSANELSSRSHCLVRVTVKGENLINGQMTRSHLWLVDLAGSERVGKIEVEGERLKESQFINKSLSALGDVVSALASKSSHIPYRNSKLTHMLQSSLGGDCKTLMFVQISPSAADLGETLCSLNFASRVRGVETGPARKQADLAELHRYKQMVEKLKHDEKETKKLQDNVQSLQLRLAAREHICRNLQEKVRDLESQLADERKTRIKNETKAYAVASTKPSTVRQQPYGKTERKPPLVPARPRLPLRKITNLTLPHSPAPPKKSSVAKIFSAAATAQNENTSRIMSDAPARRSSIVVPRRASIAVRQSSTNTKMIQPRRRVSIATFQPVQPETMDSKGGAIAPSASAARFNYGSAIRRPSIVQDPRKARYSKLFTPMTDSNNMLEMATPVATMKSSSKFFGSPQTQNSQWKPKYPAAVALQRKSFVWSPLRLKEKNMQRRA